MKQNLSLTCIFFFIIINKSFSLSDGFKNTHTLVSTSSSNQNIESFTNEKLKINIIQKTSEMISSNSNLIEENSINNESIGLLNSNTQLKSLAKYKKNNSTSILSIKVNSKDINKSKNNISSNLNQNLYSDLKIQDFINATIADEKVTSPKILVQSIETHINIRNNETDGTVTEIVKFELKNGVFDTIVRKISLGGTSEKFSNFRLISSDAKLKGASIVPNCLEVSSYNNHQYLCVISKFEEIDSTESDAIITIGYEYYAKHLLKKREKPFSTKGEHENVLIWVYDNHNKEYNIENVDLTVRINNKLDISKVTTYPEKLTSKEEIKNGLQVRWSKINGIKANEYQNFILNIPLFNDQCKQINEIHIELNTYNVIQIVFGALLAMILISLIVYVYLSNGDKKSRSDLAEDNKNLSNQSFYSNNE